ncbi:MAG: threonine synthase [Lewinellaceae bacterium]|nr:threonine synthase [Lewinellaceae bacterium]
MQLYSTKNPKHIVNFQQALFEGLPPDNGLYMPSVIPLLSSLFIQNLNKYSFQDIAFTVAQAMLNGEIPDYELHTLVKNAINFQAPVHKLDEHTEILELFHGPSLAFKDFGARFMAQTMGYFNQKSDQDLTILVATSGDTGGAVAAGFYQTPGIRVVILYPSGKVSELQEKQLTTLGHNISALEVQGTFDDCQALVKQAFLDTKLRSKINLSSANSINIARLIPQMFYYFEAYKQVQHIGKDVVFIVPSGNFGNLTAGLMAKKMGLPIAHFVAATNANDVVPEYLQTGTFKPRASKATLSNAMDVGNPSNFARMMDLYGSTWNIIKENIDGFRFSDAETRAAMREVYSRHRYILDPHGAVGYLAWRTYQKAHPEHYGIILETAHPAKFLDSVNSILGMEIEIPDTLNQLYSKEKAATLISKDYNGFKDWLHLNIK